MSAPSVPLLLEVHDLEVRYALRRGHLTAVTGVSFELPQGESLGVVGESGSGKSSIARALLRLIPASGSAMFLGQDLLRLQGPALRATRERLQIIFQDPHGALDPRMRVADIVTEPLREFRPASAAQQREEAQRLLARVGIGAELLGRYPHQLSGGQAQRVGIARALVLNPRLLICDEPMAALDVSIKAQITNLLREMRDALGLSLLLIAHDLPTVRYLCDRVLVVYEGQVMELAARDSLFGSALHPYTRALLAATPQPAGGRTRFAAAAVPEPAPAPGADANGCRFRHRCPLAVARCGAETPPLRTIGASLVACHRADEAAAAQIARGP